MAIRLSTARLAAAVAQEGGIGLIAASGMAFDELRKEIRLARKLTGGKGIIGINAMVAAREFLGLITTAAEEYGWDIDLAAVARIWRGGCIIRAKFLNRISEAFESGEANVSLLFAPYFKDAIETAERSWRRVVSRAITFGIPVPVFASSLEYFDGLRSPRLPAALIQGQRDYFGAHTYQRVDQPGAFHTLWAEPGREEIEAWEAADSITSFADLLVSKKVMKKADVADLLAAQHASLPVRLAGLLYNLGKADSPPQHLPVHYQHVERGLPRIAAIVRRFGLAPDIQALAVLTLRELERVHRAAPMRAGSITALLERVDAFGQLARYQQLLLICRCDYHAYPGNAERAYPKATLLERARQACLSVALGDGQQEDPAALHEARALAVATALRSSRWADAAE